MRDILDLSFPESNGYWISPSQELREHGNNLLQINDLRKRLQYYNEHICSLSYYYDTAEGLRIYGSWGDLDSFGQVFYNKGMYSENDCEIYLEERQREIDRLENLLQDQSSYLGKLKCLIENRKGQYRLDVNGLKVYSNEKINEYLKCNGKAANEMYVINLDPKNPEERKDYNSYLRHYVEQLIADPGKFEWLKEVKYEGFLNAPAIDVLKKQLGRAINRDSAIETEKKRIEVKFHLGYLNNYIELLYPYKVENIQAWQAAVFNAFVNGYQFDYSRKMLSEKEMKALIHVEQVVEYYKHIIDLKNAPKQKIDADKRFYPMTFELKHSINDVIERKVVDDGTIALITHLQNDGRIEYNETVKWLAETVTKYNKKIYDSNLGLGELRALKGQLQEEIKLLKDRLNKAMNPTPDAATRLSPFKVIEPDQEYAVNVGLREKVEERTKITIASLSDGLTIVETRIADQEQPPNKSKHKKLKDEDLLNNNVWKGTFEQKERLFNGLVFHSLILDTPQNKSGFLSSSPVQWLGSLVLLIFLIEQLKPKYIKTFAHLQNIIDKNFVGADYEPFGSTRQSKYNMGNNKKEPKGAEMIKSIIDSLH